VAVCPRCDAPLAPEARFCSSCGQPADEPKPDGAERHRRLAAAAPAPLAEKLRSAPLTGERKPVTALFADVVGSTTLTASMDPEEWTAIINRAFELMAQAVYRYEGTVAQLTGDGLLAFFGAPVAHEDDPERAVRAGLDIVAAIDELAGELRESHGIDFQIRVGINTGPVVVGNVGSDLRYEYTALGDAVNVAARMQAAARPGSVLTAEATHRFVAAKFDVLDLGRMAVKGKTEPVLAYEVVGVRPVPGPTRGIPGLASAMIGRDEPFAALERLLEAVHAGRGGMAIVVGEPGVGKSRLLAELKSSAIAAQDPLTWLGGQCVSYGKNLPYHLLLDLVRALLGVSATTVAAETRRALESRLSELGGDGSSDSFAYLAHLLSLELDESHASRLDRLEPEAVHAGYLGSLRQLLRASVDSSPLVVACEDIHWADPSSVDALSKLMPLAQEIPLVLICTARPERDAPGWRLVGEARDLFGDALSELTLGPLSEEESRELVGQLLEIESLPPQLRRAILVKAEGNPLFVEEVIRMLIDRGAIVQRESKWVATQDVASAEIPDTLHGLLLARVDRLPEDAKRALRVAAVIGNQFPATVLHEVLDGRDRPLPPALSTLEGSGLVRLATTRPRLEYAFRHVLVQDAAYESLLKQERRQLHGAVGDALERLHPHDGEIAGVLAFHFERAGEVERALGYLVAAGEHALQRFANREARQFLDRAASHLPRDSSEPEARRRRVEVGLGRAKAGYTFVPFDEELRLLEELVPDAEALGDLRLEAEVHLWISRNRHGHGETASSSPALTRSLDRALEIADLMGEDELRGLPLALLASSKLQAAEFRAAAALLEEAVPLLERHGDLGYASYYAGVLALSCARLGEFRRADKWMPHAYALAERSGDPNARLDADIIAGMVEAERGNLMEGIELARRGAELAGQVGNTLCELVGYFAVGDQQLRQGQPELAIPALERSSQLAEFCDAGPIANLSRAWLSAARSRQGNVDEALAGFDAALETAREMGDLLGEAEILRQRAIALATVPSPDWDAAVADFEASLRIFERIEARPYIARSLRDYGMALRASGRIDEAKAKLSRALDLFDEMDIQS